MSRPQPPVSGDPPLSFRGYAEQGVSATALDEACSDLFAGTFPAAKENVMLEKFERYPLTFGPTPVEKLARLSEHLGGNVEVWAKREDCNSGLAFGGNKLRKLEYIVPDALASGADTLVTVGEVQSNHTRSLRR